jgi:phosphoglycolate phosphatase
MDRTAASPLRTRTPNVLIDLDGTLVDPRPGIVGSVQFALKRLGWPVPDAADLLWVIGPPLRETFPKLLGGPEHVEQAVALYRENYGAGAMFDVRIYDGIVAALQDLRASGYRLFVATSKPHPFARRILDRIGLAPLFAAIYGAELDGRHDDKAELLAHLLAQEAIAPSDAVMVGDRLFDIRAAVHNGVPGVGVTWGYGSEKELSDAGAVALCRAPAQLPAIVRNLAETAR